MLQVTSQATVLIVPMFALHWISFQLLAVMAEANTAEAHVLLLYFQDRVTTDIQLPVHATSTIVSGSSLACFTEYK